MSIDITAAVEAAAVAWFDRTQAGRKDDGRLNPVTGAPWTFADLPPIDQHAAREIVLPLITAALPHIEAALREQIAGEVLSGQIKCPTHRIPDCSYLLNGCSLPSLLDGFRTGIANRIARVEVTP